MLLPLVGLVTICFKKKTVNKRTHHFRDNTISVRIIPVEVRKIEITDNHNIRHWSWHFIETLSGSCNNIFKVGV